MDPGYLVKHCVESGVALQPRLARRPDVLKRLLLLRYVLKYLTLLRKQPERTELVFLLRAYADILIPGRHLECFLDEHPPLPQPDELVHLKEGSLGHVYARHLHSLMQQDGADMSAYQL